MDTISQGLYFVECQHTFLSLRKIFSWEYLCLKMGFQTLSEVNKLSEPIFKIMTSRTVNHNFWVTLRQLKIIFTPDIHTRVKNSHNNILLQNVKLKMSSNYSKKPKKKKLFFFQN